MKKLFTYLTVAILLVGITLPSQAQFLRKNDPLTIGVKGGLNFSNYLGDDLDDTDAKTRGNVGIFLKYDVSPQFALQPEVNLSWLGAEEGISDFDPSGTYGTDGDVSLKQTYLSIPVLAKYQFQTNSGLVPNVFAGPVLSFSVDDEYEFDTNTTDDEGDLEDIGLDTNTTQFGLELGAGLQYGIFMLDARYHWGLTDVYDDYDASNSAFLISLGIGI